MESKHPKRRIDKDNPYKIFESDGHYYISFNDGQGTRHEFEIHQWLHDLFNTFELDDLVYLNEWDRHIEQSEVRESTLAFRALHKQESIEESVIRKYEYQQLYDAIKKLPEKQRRRLLWHYFDDMALNEIAQKERCSVRAVKYSLHDARDKLLKFLKKFEN